MSHDRKLFLARSAEKLHVDIYEKLWLRSALHVNVQDVTFGFRSWQSKGLARVFASNKVLQVLLVLGSEPVV